MGCAKYGTGVLSGRKINFEFSFFTTDMGLSFSESPGQGLLGLWLVMLTVSPTSIQRGTGDTSSQTARTSQSNSGISDSSALR